MSSKRLIYLPLENLRERYTQYLSAPNGVVERQCRELGVEVVPIRPHTRELRIKAGVVLDPIGRCEWSFAQVTELVKMIMAGDLGPDDCIYFEDFWTPSMEMIPYAQSLANNKSKVFAFCHAQSVDPHDFTYPMRHWMRGFEKAWLNCLTGVFCTAEEQLQLMYDGWCPYVSTRHMPWYVTGMVFDHRVLYELAGIPVNYDVTRAGYNSISRNLVVFTCRWDVEKNPQQFCELIELVLAERSDIDFAFITGASEARSNSTQLLHLMREMLRKYPNHFQIHLNQTKQQYYQRLLSADVQFNCADQDFVSYTLLEAASFGCTPLYPHYLTFPDALCGRGDLMYVKGDMLDAKKKLYNLLEKPPESYEFIYSKYERSFHRKLHLMGFDVPKPKTLRQEIDEETKRQRNKLTTKGVK